MDAPKMEKVSVPKAGVKLTRPTFKPQGMKPVTFKTHGGKFVHFFRKVKIPPTH
jgi:hypothetical protein